ncbi:class I SAM-dependent methyltransferase [Lutimonas halocynthiae]|uniref:O-methyltransferase n=1 Tax=Lutimonas halocynthiae TaxID=1446477 RepID=UPI0025B353A1|nr:class I SAM-dependent methyltransferase [Lutimonas halocynthiae]MDN3641398.1 class I SAM-dependent methyltransferase [Lutimonas halocynthiae]
MNDIISAGLPLAYEDLLAKCKEIGFTMPSDLYIGSLLKTLICSKPKANILELGTGIGLTLSWMIDGMDLDSTIYSVDNDPQLIRIATDFFGEDKRVNLICEDGSAWIKNYSGDLFDLIFADAWPGKYSDLDLTLELLKPGGFYIIDDMLSQPNWPEGHQELVYELIGVLENRKDLQLTKMNWSTGIIIVVKK